jgi:hypothetical protein
VYIEPQRSKAKGRGITRELFPFCLFCVLSSCRKPKAASAARSGFQIRVSEVYTKRLYRAD